MPSAVSSAQRAALIARALAATSPLHVLTLGLWLLVPHTDGAHEGWILAINAAVAPIAHVLLVLAGCGRDRGARRVARQRQPLGVRRRHGGDTRGQHRDGPLPLRPA